MIAIVLKPQTMGLKLGSGVFYLGIATMMPTSEIV